MVVLVLVAMASVLSSVFLVAIFGLAKSVGAGRRTVSFVGAEDMLSVKGVTFAGNLLLLFLGRNG